MGGGILAACFLLLAVSSGPNFHKQRLLANESAALRELESIYRAQAQYRNQFGEYAQTLAQLGPPPAGVANSKAAGLLPRPIAAGRHNGYVYTLTGSQAAFAISAAPEQFGVSGRRCFYLDQNMVVRQSWSSTPATAQSPELQ